MKFFAITAKRLEMRERRRRFSGGGGLERQF